MLALKSVLVVGLASLGIAQATYGLARAQAADPAAVAAFSGIPGVVAAGAHFTLFRSGFDSTEGAIAMPDGSLLFCEQNLNRVIHIGLDDSVTTYLEDANRPIGLAYDPKGRLVAAQSRDPRIGTLFPVRTSLADTFDGQRLVKPNDLVIDRKGGIYFTDPISPPATAFREPPPGRGPLLFYIRPDGTLVKLEADVVGPNGVQLSPDEKTLYVVTGDHIDAFRVRSDGTVSDQHLFADVPGDGLIVDNTGRLYAATAKGVEVMQPDGRRLGLIPAPGRLQSIAFAGKDRKTLYAVGLGNVYRMPLLVAGIRSRQK